jgi:hypothetical protein
MWRRTMLYKIFSIRAMTRMLLPRVPSMFESLGVKVPY